MSQKTYTTYTSSLHTFVFHGNKVSWYFYIIILWSLSTWNYELYRSFQNLLMCCLTVWNGWFEKSCISFFFFFCGWLVVVGAGVAVWWNTDSSQDCFKLPWMLLSLLPKNTHIYGIYSFSLKIPTITVDPCPTLYIMGPWYLLPHSGNERAFIFSCWPPHSIQH